ncbi:bifunctional GNAT family N-acetyltransferase/carbon-nitrogen hydrolase family protein [Limibacter armeniacum]|uniref:bifunctional GNAT family N-acetyltransferase/carbon-nitrogen hydrolase family protein n=1 Tax=Limibacter armeniacum TaxID=466084 RepID=UPI002FE506BD
MEQITETTEQEQHIELRHLQISDYVELNEAMIQAYSGLDMSWERKNIAKLLNIFPEGQLCIAVNGKVVASALSIIVQYGKFGDNHTFKSITGNHTFDTHDPDGDVLYGIEVFVHPDYRGMRLGRRLYDARKELCENLNLRAIIAGGRIPNYEKYADELKPREYINKVRMKQIYDPTLNFQLSNDFHVKKVLRNYLLGDTQSKEYATLLEWNNIYFEKDQPVISPQKTVVRLGLVQWQMRLFEDFEALMRQVEYFVDAVSNYHSDFVMFPEFFEAPLMEPYNHLGEATAMRQLAGYTEEIRKRMLDMAVSYNINIITGSMPYLEDDTLYNISYLLRRDGSWEEYRKIHITPSEIEAWGMVGGNEVAVFDTDCGKVGIQICYDVEFPELSRIMAEQGMQILFVPFLTDTQNGYMRVRNCAQARAIENECYVAMTGSVGNLPQVNNMDIQYAQSTIFTPSDFAFPMNTVKAEATPNTEMMVVADIDLELLKELHEHGSVRNLKDRRKDLYDLRVKK